MKRPLFALALFTALLTACPVIPSPEVKGALTVTISGAPDGATPVVNVSGPNGFSKDLTVTATLGDLEPGTYTVASPALVVANLEYSALVNGSPASVAGGVTANVAVTYQKSATLVSSLNDAGAGSLRAAIESAAPGDTLKFAAGTTGTVSLLTELEVSKNLTLEGTGVTLSAGGAHRVLSVGAGSNLTIKGLTLSGGSNVTPPASDPQSLALTDGKGGVIHNAGTLTLRSAEVSGGEADLGGGVFNASGATLTLEGGRIRGNRAVGIGAARGYGGGVYNAENATFTLTSGSIEGNNAAQLNGGVSNGGSFVMNAGKIEGNVALYVGGGVGTYPPGTFTLNGGSIENNETTFVNTGQSGSVGGGVYTQGQFVMNDGVVKNNRVKNVGGGVMVDGGSFTFKGGEISGNIAQGGAQGQAGGGVFNFKGTFRLEGGIVQNNTALDGGGITASSTTQTFITAGLIRGNTGTMRGGGLRLFSTATVTMTGGTIDGNSAPNGAGVCISGPNGSAGNNGGIFELQNGEITNNIAANNGGGIANDGVLTVSGGLIQGNSSGNQGGGIRVYKAGTLRMTGGTVKNNTATEGGGGFKLDGSSTISGGLVTGNTAKSGGGIGLFDTVLTMTGGVVSGNNGTENGGGIQVGAGSTFTLENGVVEGNTAKNSAGINSYKSTVTIKGGFVRNNAALESSGGVGTGENIALTIQGGEISGNTAKYGAGINIFKSTLTIQGGIVRGNTASVNGGGIQVGTDSVLNRTGGTVSGNAPQDIFPAP